MPEVLTATRELLLRLENRMSFVLLGLRGILNAVVLRLEIRRSVQLEPGEVGNSAWLRIQVLAGRAGYILRDVGDGARSFASCMLVAPGVGAAAPTQSGDA
jgi:hypothetical protein